MATVYKVEIVSDWISYHEDDLKELVQNTLNKHLKEFEVPNTIRVTEVVEK